MQEQKKLSQKVSELVAGNRELKGQLLEAERYKDLVEKAMARIKALEQSIETMEKDIVDTRYHIGANLIPDASLRESGNVSFLNILVFRVVIWY